MTRSMILNALFLLAGCSSAAVETILYRVALVAIVVMLHTLWLRAKVKRTIRAAFDENLDDAESALVAERNRRIAHRTV